MTAVIATVLTPIHADAAGERMDSDRPQRAVPDALAAEFADFPTDLRANRGIGFACPRRAPLD
jgi:hypothetical protein